MRHSVASTLAVAALTLTTLGACGGDDDSRVSATKPSSAVRDKDGFTPAQREVVDAVDQYMRVVVDYQKGESGADLASVATPETVTLVTDGTKTLLEGGKKTFVGTYELTPSKVTIKGDVATYMGCADFSRSGIVDEGETAIGPDDTPGAKTPTEYTLERGPDGWKMADPKGGTGPCPS